VKTGRVTLLAAALSVAAATALPASSALAETVQNPVVHMSDVTFTTGTPVTVTFSPDGFGDTVPVAYRYRFGTGATQDAPATAGVATIQWDPSARVTPLNVQGVAADGTLSLNTFNYYFASSGVVAGPDDLNGDGRPDLLTNGGTKGLGSGMWQALGATRSGRVKLPATSILDGSENQGDPTAYDGAQLVTGDFSGEGFQDVLAYYPSGQRAGVALIIKGQGDGSHLYDFDYDSISQPTLTDPDGNNPIQLANSYDNAFGIDGLLGTFASALYVYPSPVCPACFFGGLPVNATTPDGTNDWGTWRMATAKVASGAAMYLWQPSTGKLYLWSGLTFTDNGDGTASAAYTPYLVSGHWKKGANPATIEAADFSGDGIPDLWVVSANGSVQPFVVSHLKRHGHATITTKPAQRLG
jgi:hypothetical protein